VRRVKVRHLLELANRTNYEISRRADLLRAGFVRARPVATTTALPPRQALPLLHRLAGGKARNPLGTVLEQAGRPVICDFS